MKKVILFFLSAFSFLSLSAQINKSDAVGDVCVPYPVMKSIQTDLLIGDSATAVLNVTNFEVKELKRKIFEQMNQIDNLKSSENNLKAMNDNLKKQIDLNNSIVNSIKSDYNKLNKSYKRNKVKNTILQVVGIGAGIFITAQAIRYRNLYIKHM